jgi:hypothetical protein
MPYLFVSDSSWHHEEMVLKERDFDKQDEVLSCRMGFKATCVEFECELWRNPREREPERFSIVWRDRDKERERERERERVFIFCSVGSIPVRAVSSGRD